MNHVYWSSNYALFYKNVDDFLLIPIIILKGENNMNLNMTTKCNLSNLDVEIISTLISFTRQVVA